MSICSNDILSIMVRCCCRPVVGRRQIGEAATAELLEISKQHQASQKEMSVLIHSTLRVRNSNLT